MKIDIGACVLRCLSHAQEVSHDCRTSPDARLLMLVGMLYFPRPWREFVRWYAEKASINAVACIPALISNRWWLKEPEKVR